jgi:hypothetical protein
MDQAELAAFRDEHSDRQGRLAAKLFELFDQGLTLAEIVKELRVSPDVVRQYYVEYNSDLPEFLAEKMAKAAADEKAKKKALALREQSLGIKKEELEVRAANVQARRLEKQLEHQQKPDV